jgi:hypothetical protein
MMTVIPPKPARSRTPAKRSKRRSASDPKKCEVQPPQIYVRRIGEIWGGHQYAPAKIRVRKGVYRYLVWRDGLFKFEFYLGKIKNLATRDLDIELAGTGARPGAAPRSSGGKKSSEKP